MKNVEAITLSVSIPIIEAASRSNAVARMALPRRVRDTSSVRAIISATLVRDDEQLHDRDGPPENAERRVEQRARLAGIDVAADRVGRVAVALTFRQQQHAVGEEERNAERADERRDPRRVPQRTVGETLDDDAERARSRHSSREHQQDQRHERDRGGERPAEDRQHAVAEKRPDHVDLAVGEVQELEDPVHHRVAESDECVQAPEHEPVAKQLESAAPPQLADRVEDVEEGEVVQVAEGCQKRVRPTEVGRTSSVTSLATSSDAVVVAVGADPVDRRSPPAEPCRPLPAARPCSS